MITWRVGDISHVYIGWGEIIEIIQPGGWYVLRFDSGMQGTFPVNQLSSD